MKQQQTTTDLLSDAFINIIGSNVLQNELLLSFLEDKIGLTGKCLSRLEPKCLSSTSESGKPIFFLIDCKSINIKNFFKEIHSLKESNPSQCYVALCNVNSNAEIVKKALNNGIDGVFFDNDHPQTIHKGILSILNGDLWYSRKTMTKFLLEPKTSANELDKSYAKNLLTFREREVLALIASGNNSREVSDKLCVSSHTVKTHIYNIYNKINVTNRLQATLWAAKYM